MGDLVVGARSGSGEPEGRDSPTGKDRPETPAEASGTTAAAVMEEAIALASHDTAGIHVSFDLDVCDPAIAPGVGTPVRGGLNYREAHMAMEMLADARLLALDLVEVNPVFDVQNMTAVLAAELAASAMGMRIL